MTFGSVVGIRILRSIQLLLLAAAVDMRPQSSEPIQAWLFLIPILLAEGILTLVVCARLDATGISYCRWSVWRTVDWSSVESIKAQRLAGLLTIKLANRPLWRRYLLLGRAKGHVASRADLRDQISALQSLAHAALQRH